MPSVGDTVLYHVEGRAFAALVVHVHDATTVDLTAFGQNGLTFAVQGALWLPGNVARSDSRGWTARG